MILFLAGTSDARELALGILKKGKSLLATVVTENAAKSLEEAGIPTRVGRLTSEEMAHLIDQREISMVVDASHPFAEEASKNAIAAAQMTGRSYIRYERPAWQYHDHPLLKVVSSYEEAAQEAFRFKGTIMLTTGSKTLHVFAQRLLGDPEISLIARMLPRRENMEKCEQLGIEQRNIIAMQGPFGRKLNIALYEHYGVTTVITKESGKEGSVDEKVETALEMDINVILISRPNVTYGTVFSNPQDIITQL